MQGAPDLSGTAGSLVTVLDAVLVDGFGTLTLDSLSVSGGIATATYSTGFSYKQWSVVEIAGATPSGLNGRKRLLTASGTTVTFDATGISDQTATGTITIKIPSAGWTIAYTGTNLRSYRLDNTFGTGCYLRVDDTGTTAARVVGYQAMTDINTGTDPFPTNAQISGGGYWVKSSTANSTERAWIIVADDRGVYFSSQSDGTNSKTHWFGDQKQLTGTPGQWDCCIICATTASGTGYPGYIDGSTSNQRLYFPRNLAEASGAVAGSKHSILNYSSASLFPYPSVSVGGILALVDFVVVREGTSNAEIRGLMPGYIAYVNDVDSYLTFNTPLLIDGFSAYHLPLFTGDTNAPVFGVSLGDWR
jgi:hypothetical protein